MIQKTNINNAIQTFAKMDLALIVEEQYKILKHIDIVVFTMLKNQETLSISNTLAGGTNYVDGDGNIFIRISQKKLAKILNTSLPTLRSSLNRLEECELLDIVKKGANECSRMYLGTPISTTTLGDYVKKIGLELDEEEKEKEEKLRIKTSNINDFKPVEVIEEVKEQNKFDEIVEEETKVKVKEVVVEAAAIPKESKSIKEMTMDQLVIDIDYKNKYLMMVERGAFGDAGFAERPYIVAKKLGIKII